MTDFGYLDSLNYNGIQPYMYGYQSMPYMSYMPYQNYSTNIWQGVPYSLPQYGYDMYYPTFAFGSSSSSSSSSNKYMTVEEYRRQQAESYKNAFKSRQQEEIKNGPTAKEWEILSKEYAKGLAPSESFTGAVAGTAVVAPVFGAGKMKRAFSQGESGEQIKKIIETEEKAKALYGKMDGNKVAREIAEKLRILEDMAKREKATVFRSKCDPAIYDKSIKNAVEILKSGDYERLVLLNEQLSQVTVKNNWFARTWRSLRGESELTTDKLLEVFNPSTDKYNAARKAAEKTLGLTEGALVEGATRTAEKTGNNIATKALKGIKGHAGGAAVMAGIEILMKIPDIQEAFSKDSATGWKQVGQTTLKAAGSAIGWIAGEAAASAAAGALLGSVAPGIGTAIGFVVGMIGGAIGCWLAGKATHAIVGEDVANKVKAEKMLDAQNNQKVQNPDGTIQPTGKEQLLQYAIAMHGQGKASPETEQILRKYQLVA